MDQGNIFGQVVFFLMQPDNAAVDFQADHLSGGEGQGPGEGAQADTYLHDDIIAGDSAGMNDGCGRPFMDQEILAESFFWGQVVLFKRCSGVMGCGHRITMVGLI